MPSGTSRLGEDVENHGLSYCGRKRFAHLEDFPLRINRATAGSATAGCGVFVFLSRIVLAE